MQRAFLASLLSAACVVYATGQTYAPVPQIVPVLPVGITSVPVAPMTPITLQMPAPTLYLDTTRLPAGVHVTETTDSYGGGGNGGRRYDLAVDDGSLPSGKKIAVQRVAGTDMAVVVLVTATPNPDNEEGEAGHPPHRAHPEDEPSPTPTPTPISNRNGATRNGNANVRRPTPTPSPTPTPRDDGLVGGALVAGVVTLAIIGIFAWFTIRRNAN